MSKYTISIRPFGIHAILIEWPKKVEVSILHDIIRYTQYLEAKCLNEGSWEIVSAYNSVTLISIDHPINFLKFKEKLMNWYENSSELKKAHTNLWRLPVCYDLNYGIDLEEVSEKLGVSIPEIIKMHTAQAFTVYGIGFLPGFMYLGGLPRALEIPRKSTPRLKVAKGAVGIAAMQTGIYPQESPGGWNIIGNCPVPLFNAKKKDPCFVNLGDTVQFYKIEKAEYDLRKIEVEVGIYKLQKKVINA